MYPMTRCRTAGPIAVILSVVVLTMVVSGVAVGQELQPELSALKGELASVRSEIQALRRELRQLRRLLTQQSRRQKPPARAKVVIKDRPYMGRLDAPVVVVEFSDYQCPYCRRFSSTVLPKIKKAYIDTGKVRYVFKDFPIQQIHPRAMEAAIAAHCTGEQGRYWDMHDLLFAYPRKITTAGLKEHAATLGLDSAKFDECLRKDRIKKQVIADLREGAAVGVRGTPTFVVAPSAQGDSVEGIVIRGAQSFEIFQRSIQKILNKVAGVKR